jgi:hypothetical protein
VNEKFLAHWGAIAPHQNQLNNRVCENAAGGREAYVSGIRKSVSVKAVVRFAASVVNTVLE